MLYDDMNSYIDLRDGKVYKTVKIGRQVWMAEDLVYMSTNDDGFYDWETANKACPLSWHLPSKKEWQTLVDFAGGEKIAGKKLKATSGWDDPKEELGNGTDDFGFSALPIITIDNDQTHRKILGLWWSSSSECDSNNAYALRIMNSNESAKIMEGDKNDALKIRCIQDDKPWGPELLCSAEVRMNGMALEYVPEYLKTEDLCNSALYANYQALEYVPENLKTVELCAEAVKQWVIQHLQYDNKFLHSKGYHLSDILEYMPEKVKAAAVERCLKYIENITDVLNTYLDPFPYR